MMKTIFDSIIGLITHEVITSLYVLRFTRTTGMAYDVANAQLMCNLKR